MNWIRGSKGDPVADPYKRQSYPITGLDRLLGFLGFQEVDVPRTSRQSEHAGGPSLLPERYTWYTFLLEAEPNPGPQSGRDD